ncbi:uncharacterized protein LOC111460137 [Cucurbita moschata]|uniref:Uncharacterized protein LOC111460137 n=1 Tax=Cucurbita moschata TaxID=3662 RepID=A0A6J1H554_CUCMO|nr:uncharacterized protein LOC111460137 [Cucurbita moschata]
MTFPPPVTPQPARDSAAELTDVLRIVVRNLSDDQSANNSASTREARCLRDFKRGDPQTFKETSDGPTETQSWLSSIETVFRLTNCLKDQKVECAAFMLPGGEISWTEFKEAFAEVYYPDDVQIRKHQELTHLKQKGHSVTAYAREFTKLKCFAPDLVDTNYRTARQFVLGLDRKIRNVVEAIAPTTYAESSTGHGGDRWIERIPLIDLEMKTT